MTGPEIPDTAERAASLAMSLLSTEAEVGSGTWDERQNNLASRAQIGPWYSDKAALWWL
jgi:hypothetical protein